MNALRTISYQAKLKILQTWMNVSIQHNDESFILTALHKLTALYKIRHYNPENSRSTDKNLIKICLEKNWSKTLECLAGNEANYKPHILNAISSNNANALMLLLKNFRGDINASITGKPHETLLWYALEKNNYAAAEMLMSFGATLDQPMPDSIKVEIRKDYERVFYKNSFYYGRNGHALLTSTLNDDIGETLGYALAGYFYYRTSEALEFLLRNPKHITLNVLKIIIHMEDAAAFKKLLPLFLKQTSEDCRDEILMYILRDFHFSLMGYNFDYILTRAEIIEEVLKLKPPMRAVDKYGMTLFEISRYLSMYLESDPPPPKLKRMFSQLLADPTGFHDIWRIQKLLVNDLATLLKTNDKDTPVEIACYPHVHTHITKSIFTFFKERNLLHHWVFVTPAKEFSAECCLKLLDQNKILKIFTGWTHGWDEGHGINCVMYDRYLIVCNRGGGSNESTCGVQVFLIDSRESLTDIMKIILARTKETETFISGKLNTDPRLQRVHYEKFKPQKRKNCVWLSEKIGVYGGLIASFLAMGCPVRGAAREGLALYKEWSREDRLNLIKSYLSHPYHLRGVEANEKEGILLREIIKKITIRTPKSQRFAFFDEMLNLMQNVKFKEILGNSYNLVITDLLVAQFNAALNNANTTQALSVLSNVKDVNFPNSHGETLLHLCCRHYNYPLAKKLINMGANPNLKSKMNLTPIEETMFHTEGKTKQFLKYIISKTDFDALAKHQLFPLHTAIARGQDLTVDLILESGFSLDHANSQGDTGYHIAAISKFFNVMKKILSQCPDLNLKSKSGKTLLYKAVEHNWLPGVRWLLLHGANPNIKSDEGVAPIEIASPNQFEIFKLLIKHNACLNLNDDIGSSLLMQHISKGNGMIAEILLEAPRIDISKVNAKGENAIMLAVGKGMLTIVQILLSKGSNPNATNLFDESLLHIAVKNNDEPMCRLLLENHADVTLASFDEITPLDIAKQNQNEALIQLLSGSSVT